MVPDGVVVTMVYQLRQIAGENCPHCCRIETSSQSTQPWGDLFRQEQWCREHAGMRWTDWWYEGDGEWCFRNGETMVHFHMVWS